MSKLKGLRINVRGNSFAISIKTISEAIRNGFFRIGKLILKSEFVGLELKILEALLILAHCFFILDCIGCQATAKNRTPYAKIKPKAEPIIKVLKKVFR